MSGRPPPVLCWDFRGQHGGNGEGLAPGVGLPGFRAWRLLPGDGLAGCGPGRWVLARSRAGGASSSGDLVRRPQAPEEALKRREPRGRVLCQRGRPPLGLRSSGFRSDLGAFGKLDATLETG